MLTAIKRYLIILVAYLLTVAVTALGVGGLMFTIKTGESFLPFLPYCALVGMITCIFASAPAAVVVAIAEWWPFSRLWFYAGVAAVFGLALSSIFMIEKWFPVAGVVLGAVAGSVYWAVAGRNAGVLKKPETARAQTHLLLLLGTSVVLIVVLILVFLR